MVSLHVWPRRESRGHGPQLSTIRDANEPARPGGWPLWPGLQRDPGSYPIPREKDKDSDSALSALVPQTQETQSQGF